MEKKAFRKKDLLLILPCLLLALGLILWMNLQPSSSGIAIVEKDGKEVQRIDLGKQTSERIIDIGGEMHIKLKVEPGAISFYKSDCPDKICIRTGKLTKPGQTAVCLPGKVSVHIVSSSGNASGSYDALTQ